MLIESNSATVFSATKQELYFPWVLFLADRFIITCLLSNNHLILLTNSQKKVLITVSDCSLCTFYKNKRLKYNKKKKVVVWDSLILPANQLRCPKLWSFPASLIAVKRLFKNAIWCFFSIARWPTSCFTCLRSQLSVRGARRRLHLAARLSNAFTGCHVIVIRRRWYKWFPASFREKKNNKKKW